MVSFSFAGHLYLQAPNSKRNWDLYRGVLSRRLYQQNHHGVWLHQMFYNSSILKSVRAVSLCLLKYNKLIYKLYDFFFFFQFVQNWNFHLRWGSRLLREISCCEWCLLYYGSESGLSGQHFLSQIYLFGMLISKTWDISNNSIGC